MTMGFQLSPGVQSKEIDLTTSIPAVATSLGATVGRFTWGPCNQPYLITSESDLVSVFGKPTNDTYPAFLSSAAFLTYANSLQVVRVVDSGATNSTTNAEVVKIENDEDFDTKLTSGALGEAFYARYPGTYGNDISVYNSDGVSWSTWTYAGAFDVQPDTTNNEIAVAVVIGDEVVESYLVSNISGTKDTMGGNIFMEEVINKMSKLVWTVAANVVDTGDQTSDLTGGLAMGAAGSVGADEYQLGWDKFANADAIDVNLLIAGGVTNEEKTIVTAVEKHMVEVIAEVRKDCMAIISPAKELVVNVGGEANAVTNVIAWRTGELNIASSYGTLDCNYKYTYDKYADTYRWIGLSGDIAGLMANTDDVRDAWWSPAGLNRGIIKSVVKLAYNPNEAQRDQLYKLPNGINPVVSFPGQGTVLWGDRTLLTKPSAFDRINVRRLFIVLEKSIAISAKYFLFEFNNAFARNNFKNIVVPYLGGLQARQAMIDFHVVCDASNNGPEVVDANNFVASIFIKPSKSINFITLNFVATKTGVSFAEVIGQV
jgi:phage tail sheath protein FI